MEPNTAAPLDLTKTAGTSPPEWEQIRRAIAKGDQAYREAGRLLIDLKAKTPRGEWLPTLKREKIDERQARRLMELAQSDAGVRFTDICHPAPREPRTQEQKDAELFAERRAIDDPKRFRCCGGHPVAGHHPRCPENPPTKSVWVAPVEPISDERKAQQDRAFLLSGMGRLDDAVLCIEKNRESIGPAQIEVLTAAWERLGAIIERWGIDGAEQTQQQDRRELAVAS